MNDPQMPMVFIGADQVSALEYAEATIDLPVLSMCLNKLVNNLGRNERLIAGPMSLFD